MKIQCHVCEAAEAAVLCCADEAALCRACDEKVHAANKLASKHQRVSLSNSASQMPKCDICQEMVGYFFCLEDRALLCRNCDVAIHTVNPHVSAHQRFLLTGVKVGLEPTEPGSTSSTGKPLSGEKVLETETCFASRSAPMSVANNFENVAPTQSSGIGDLTPSKRSAPMLVANKFEKVAPTQNSGVENLAPSKRSAPMSLAGDYSKILPVQDGGVGDFSPSRMSFAGGSATGSITQWHIDDFLGLSEFNHGYGFPDHGSSKADSGKLGESDSSMLKSSEDDLDSDERLGQVPDVAWRVPQVLSPPTASGLYWPYNSQDLADSAVFVPDISWSPLITNKRRK
ncbi:hypothetical protein Ancab_004103 [Ancistrocladus abbreviatus]